METFNTKLFMEKARAAVSGKNVRRVAALHAGVVVAAGFLVTLLQYALAEGIGNTSGLSGMGTRAILETGQTVLQWANMVLVPFWNLGFLFVALQWARGNLAGNRDLLKGFQRIGPCLGLLVNRFLIMFAAMFLSAYACTGIYMTMPASAPLMELATASGGDMDVFYASLEQMDLTALMGTAAPLLILWGCLSLVLLVPLLYRFRFAEFAILNHQGVRGLPAMLISAALLRRRCWQLFKLDLRFWWYYGLKVLCMLLAYGHLLLAVMGIALPFDGEAAGLIFYLLYLLGLFAVETLCRPLVETAYAAAYEAAMETGPVPKKTQSIPQNVPWDET